MKSKYTFIYNTEIEKTLDSALADIAEETRADTSFRHLKYLVLGGGYGRGEGGILIKENGEVALYNDLDFFVNSDTNYNRHVAQILNALEENQKQFNFAIDYRRLPLK